MHSLFFLWTRNSLNLTAIQKIKNPDEKTKTFYIEWKSCLSITSLKKDPWAKKDKVIIVSRKTLISD